MFHISKPHVSGNSMDRSTKFESAANPDKHHA